MNNSHKLTRKTNDSHSRTTDYQNKTCPKPKENTPSVFKLDLLRHPVPNLITHSSKKRKLSPSSGRDLRPMELSPLKLMPKEPPSNRKQIHLNITTHFKPIQQKKPLDKIPQIDLRQKTSWESIRPVFRSNATATTKTVQANDSTPQRGQPITLQSLKPVSPLPVVAKTNQSHQITSPLNTVWIPKKTVDKGPKVDLKLTSLEPDVRAATRTNQSIRPLNSSTLLTTPILVHKKQAIPTTVSPPNNKRKNRNLLPDSLFNRAKKIVEADQSSRRIWQSDLDAGASLRGTKTKKFQIVKVSKELGTQIVQCIEIGNTQLNTTLHHYQQQQQQQQETEEEEDKREKEKKRIWKIFLKSDDVNVTCKDNDRIKIYHPWIEIHDKNFIISNRFIIL